MARRVCHLTYEYWPHIYGGLGRAVTQLTTALARRGWQVEVATLGRRSSALPSSHEGVALHRVRGVPAIGDGTDWAEAVGAFDAALLGVADPLAARADVLHVHDWFAVETALQLQYRYDIPLVVTVHATERGRHQGWLPDSVSRFVDAQERRLAAAADRLIVCSSWMREAIVRWWEIPPAAVIVIPNGTNPVRDASPHSDRSGVLLAGRCEHEKGGQVLLAALDLLRRQGVEAALTVAGEGSQRTALQRLAAELAVDADFPGHLDDADLAAAYRRAAVVVVPSLYEPFGLVAAEAMAAGAAVVASATGGLAETVGDGGVLVAPEDPDALAAALLPLLTQPTARAAAEARARRRAAALPTWAQAAEQTAAVYAGLGAPSRRTLAD